MKVVVNVSQIFLGKGKSARRYRRGDLVEVEGKTEKDVPKWAVSLKTAKDKFDKQQPPPEEPKTLSELSASQNKGPTKAFGQEV